MLFQLNLVIHQIVTQQNIDYIYILLYFYYYFYINSKCQGSRVKNIVINLILKKLF